MSSLGRIEVFRRGIRRSGALVVIGIVVGATVSPVAAAARGEAVVVFGEVAEIVPLGGGEGDELGAAVAASEEVVVVGAAGDDERGSSAGAVYVHLRDARGRWVQVEKLLADDASANDGFGSSVDLSADGRRLVVGAPFAEAAGSGAAYLYERQSDDVWLAVARLTPRDGLAVDQFGQAVAVDGDRLVIGAPADSAVAPQAGSAYVFERSPDGIWEQAARLTASDADLLDQFGSSVSIDGSTLAVGAPLDDDLGPSSGSIYLFERDADGIWLEVAKRTPLDGENGDLFGETLALDDEWLAVGASFDDGAEDFTGAVYLFSRAGGRWEEAQKIVPEDSEFFDLFGTSVALAGERLVVGAIGDDNDGSFSGSAYLLELVSGEWVEVAEIASGSASSGDEFGSAVATAPGLVVVGSRRDDARGFDSGAASVFERVPVLPTLETEGTCPGEIRIVARGVTPRDTLQLYGGTDGGATPVVGGPCDGTLLSLERPEVLREETSTFTGRGVWVRPVDDLLCGLSLQLLDERTCQVSGVVSVSP